MRFMVAVWMVVSGMAMGQSSVAVKATPASDALTHAAQNLSMEQKSFDVLLNQARSTMDANQKSLQSQLLKANTDLLAELKADKKYKDKFSAIEAMQKQIQSVSQQASEKFNQDANPIQNEIAKDKALIEGLTQIVRKENDLPASASFDVATQKWTISSAADKPSEAKK